MTWEQFKENVNNISDAKPIEGWDYVRILTLLQDVVLDLDKIQSKYAKTGA